MSTLAEIEAAVAALPAREQEALFTTLAKRLKLATVPDPKRPRRGLKSAALLALGGLPPDLSVGTKDRVRTLLRQRHAANR